MSRRQPRRNRPRNASATTMNAAAVPWPETTRKIMPSVTVHSQITIPAGRSARGYRQARAAIQPAAEAAQERPGGRRDPGERLALGVTGAPDHHEDEHAADVCKHRNSRTPGQPHAAYPIGDPPYRRRRPRPERARRARPGPRDGAHGGLLPRVCPLQGRAWTFVCSIFS